MSRDLFLFSWLLLAGNGLASAPTPSLRVQSDLDAFMQKVLARRDENWKKLQQYVLDERERVEVRGASKAPIWGERREYTWFIQDGFFIRSPLSVNGVAISEPERRKYEASYLKRAKNRDKRPPKGAAATASPSSPEHGTPEEAPKDVESFIKQVRQPEFIESAYFLRFKFEQGKYALVGHETFEGRDALRIEYYPARLFSQDRDRQEQQKQQQKQKEQKPDSRRGQDFEATMEKMMNKVALITLWIDPKDHQIVKYTFDNVNFDFLPAAWLVRVNDLKASMTMSQPFKDVWLPRDLDMYASAMLAIGSFDVRYHLDYHDYRQAETSGRVKGRTER